VSSKFFHSNQVHCEFDCEVKRTSVCLVDNYTYCPTHLAELGGVVARSEICFLSLSNGAVGTVMPGALFAKPGAWPSVVICRSVL
jgi:hypothetical protein